MSLEGYMDSVEKEIDKLRSELTDTENLESAYRKALALIPSWPGIGETAHSQLTYFAELALLNPDIDMIEAVTLWVNKYKDTPGMTTFNISTGHEAEAELKAIIGDWNDWDAREKLWDRLDQEGRRSHDHQ